MRYLVVTNGWIAHLDNIPWYEQPTPPRWHRCTPTTTACLGVLYPQHIQRCSCGAWRVRHFGAEEFTEWRERNSRRRGTARNLTTF